MRLPIPYRAEDVVVAHRLQALQKALDWAQVMPVAAPWVQAVRDNPPPFWAMESLLKEYPISSSEGLALMRLAEALLRVPDAATAIALTADQLGRANFEDSSDQTLARLSSAAIAMSKRFLPDPSQDDASPGLLAKLGQKTVVAATLRAVALLGRQFVLGQTIQSAMQEANKARQALPNLGFSYDMLGEGARTDADALQYLAHYQNALKAIATEAIATKNCSEQDGISIKLSALHPRYEDAQLERVLSELVPRVWQLCELAASANINLTIDAEEVDRLELSLHVFEALVAKIAQHTPQWRGFGLAMQSYQTRALELIEHVALIARQYKVKLMCRLVKGAYWDAEIKRTQEMGLPHYPVFTHKHHTDISYLACAHAMLMAKDVIFPQFATHNAATIAAIIQMATNNGAPFELQRLHGMGEGVYREVLKNPTIRCRVYAPVGAHRDLLAYLVRRLLENGANSSFVHQLADEDVAVNELLKSPLWMAPQPSLPLPFDLFRSEANKKGRDNSKGLDLTVASQAQPLLDQVSQIKIDFVPLASPEDVKQAAEKAVVAFTEWDNVNVNDRSQILREAAKQLEQQLPQFCAILVKEAFKTWGDAVSEVREAIDFLRYYADQASDTLQDMTMPGPTGESNIVRLTGRGAWVCISPWNFPLAIFMGQVAAALVTGNTVLAKPAEQTPFVASQAVALLHAAGVPKDVLQLLNGPGETVGAGLIAQDNIAGVVFTGSTQVAKIIQRALANKEGPIVPLIAETGGINAMIVDSTALPEQVCDSVIQSAFRSAGQRCSALRLLCVHEEIADKVIEMIAGATQELVVGDTSHLSTDVGPVIDEEAYNNIQNHIAKLVGKTKSLLPVLENGHTVKSYDSTVAHLISPQAYEVQNIADVQQEIFGPVLHVVRWNGDPSAVVKQINQLGYGLTLGIHTRIDSRAQRMAHSAKIGNVYINRNQIGAVVGVQPFGGEGLSGTGPKAGGPLYLFRFVAEQTITINTTAAGGNVTLMSQI